MTRYVPIRGGSLYCTSRALEQAMLSKSLAHAVRESGARDHRLPDACETCQRVTLFGATDWSSSPSLNGGTVPRSHWNSGPWKR